MSDQEKRVRALATELNLSPAEVLSCCKALNIAATMGSDQVTAEDESRIRQMLSGDSPDTKTPHSSNPPKASPLQATAPSVAAARSRRPSHTIFVLGDAGSGKTVLQASIYRYLSRAGQRERDRLKGWALDRPDQDTHRQANEVIDPICDTTEIGSHIATQLGTYDLLRFSLRRENSVQEIVCFDMAGEAIRELAIADQELTGKAKRFLNDVPHCRGLVLLIDPTGGRDALLLQDDMYYQMFMTLEHLIGERVSHLPIVFAFSKCDDPRLDSLLDEAEEGWRVPSPEEREDRPLEPEEYNILTKEEYDKFIKEKYGKLTEEEYDKLIEEKYNILTGIQDRLAKGIIRAHMPLIRGLITHDNPNGLRNHHVTMLSATGASFDTCKNKHSIFPWRVADPFVWILNHHVDQDDALHKQRCKKAIVVFLLLLLIAAGCFGYQRYAAYRVEQRHIAEQKQRAEEVRIAAIRAEMAKNEKEAGEARGVYQFLLNSLSPTDRQHLNSSGCAEQWKSIQSMVEGANGINDHVARKEGYENATRGLLALLSPTQPTAVSFELLHARAALASSKWNAFDRHIKVLLSLAPNNKEAQELTSLAGAKRAQAAYEEAWGKLSAVQQKLIREHGGVAWGAVQEQLNTARTSSKWPAQAAYEGAIESLQKAEIHATMWNKADIARSDWQKALLNADTVLLNAYTKTEWNELQDEVKKVTALSLSDQPSAYGRFVRQLQSIKRSADTRRNTLRDEAQRALTESGNVLKDSSPDNNVATREAYRMARTFHTEAKQNFDDGQYVKSKRCASQASGLIAAARRAAAQRREQLVATKKWNALRISVSDGAKQWIQKHHAKTWNSLLAELPQAASASERTRVYRDAHTQLSKLIAQYRKVVQLHQLPIFRPSRKHIDHNAAIGAIATHPTRNSEFASGELGSLTQLTSSNVFIYDERDKATKAKNGDWAWSLIYCQKGTWLAVSKSEDIQLWRADGRELFTLKGHKAGVKTLAEAPDGSILSGSTDKTIRRWDLSSRKELWETPVELPDWCNSLSVSPDGERVAASSLDRTVRILDLKTGIQQGETIGPFQSVVSKVFFTPSGKNLVVVTLHSVIRMDVESGTQAVVYKTRGTSMLSAAAAAPSGRYIAVADMDQTIDLNKLSSNFLGSWLKAANKIEKGKYKILLVDLGQFHTPRELPFRAHKKMISALAFSADGRTLYSGCWGDTVQEWEIKAE